MRGDWLFVVAACAVAFASSAGHAAAPRQLSLGVNDLVWDAAHARIWASVRGPGAYEDQIVAIDPLTGALGPTLPMGGEAGPLAISDDGTALYVGVASAFAVREVDLATLTVVASFGVGTHPPYGELFALDIEVQPGTNDVIAVARHNALVTTLDGVAILEGGVLRSLATPAGYVSSEIVFDATGSRLFGVGLDGLSTIQVDATGASLLSVRQGVSGADFSGGWLIGSGAWDPLSERLRGSYALPTYGMTTGGLEADDARVEVYRATTRAILVYDRDEFRALGHVPLPPSVQGLDAPFVRWGSRSFALAMRNASSSVVVIVDGAEYVADVDHDLVGDAADDCPEIPNAPQLDADGDGLGDACDPTPRTDPFPALQMCAGELAVQSAIVSQRISELEAARAEHARASDDVNQCISVNDLDGDGERNAQDRCPGSTSFADEAGCSRAQFCAALPKSLCKRGDWLNDQPGAKKPFDCTVTGATCVPF